MQEFQSQAEALDRAAEAAARRDGLDPSRLASLNDAISAVERAFLLGEGLPGRPWFKHAVYAPGLTTGYAAWPLPGDPPGDRGQQAGADGATAVSKTVERIRQAADALKAATDRARATAEQSVTSLDGRITAPRPLDRPENSADESC